MICNRCREWYVPEPEGLPPPHFGWHSMYGTCHFCYWYELYGGCLEPIEGLTDPTRIFEIRPLVGGNP